jgi:exopolysaccharide production protein ExoY
MSLVGPRPIVPDELEYLWLSHARSILEPGRGVTGVWQISGRNCLSYPARVSPTAAMSEIGRWQLILPF